jgi:hypothetical protein
VGTNISEKDRSSGYSNSGIILFQLIHSPSGRAAKLNAKLHIGLLRLSGLNDSDKLLSSLLLLYSPKIAPTLHT